MEFIFNSTNNIENIHIFIDLHGTFQHEAKDIVL